ncbi:general secretion pathway protein D [Thermodesulforhabdus norvegica]|uniref:General secretion pathway protein D n=1 Tax=Thermodesulforhabdus norvegica TaxID=39841 RepID=A0A1I4SS25_9BACT|nr:general secretion pathway protein D [Thermodesulforhabdus norvegica]
MVAGVVALFFLSSCSSLQRHPSAPGSLVPEQIRQTLRGGEQIEAKREEVPSAPGKAPEEGKEKPLSFPEQRPSGRFGILAPSERAIPEKPSPEQLRRKVVFNFDRANIVEVTQQIFGEYLKVNYVLDPALNLSMSFYLEGEYSNDELLMLLSQVYSAHGVDVFERDGVYYIQLAARTRGSGLSLVGPRDLEASRQEKPAICMYRLQFIDAKQAQGVIQPFLTVNRPVSVDPVTNTLIFVDTMDNIRTLVDILRLLDVNIFDQMGIEIVTLEYLNPVEAADAFNNVMDKLNESYKQMISRNLALIPMERISALILVSPDRHILDTAKKWIKSLDVEGRDSGEQFFIYFVQNGLAKNIVDVLKEVFTGGSEEKHTGVQIVKAEEQKSQGEQAKTPGVSAKLAGEVTIIADETNNAIIVKALPGDYEKIKKAIETLDVLPRGVLIELLIAEITLTDETQYGVEWYLKNKGMDIGGYAGQYSIVQNYGVPFNRDFDLGTATSQGLSLFWGSLEGDIASLINLLSSFSHFKVLSAPTILATDNKEASITVGGSTPVVSQQSVDTAGETLINTVNYVDTGIILKVTPHINEGGIVRLEVEQTIRDAVKNTVSGIDSPAFTERKISTTLLARDGNTVVIGGIIQEKTDTTRTGIPFLSRIPILSPLFSSTDTSLNRTELLVAITPRVIDHAENEAAAEFLKKLNLLREVIAGEAEPSKPTRPPLPVPKGN